MKTLILITFFCLFLVCKNNSKGATYGKGLNKNCQNAVNCLDYASQIRILSVGGQREYFLERAKILAIIELTKEIREIKEKL